MSYFTYFNSVYPLYYYCSYSLILLSFNLHTSFLSGWSTAFSICLPLPVRFFFFHIFYLFIYLFIYFWLCWVFVSARGLSPVAASRGHSSSRCAGLSLSRPLLLRSTGSRCAGSVVVAHGPRCSAACGIFLDQGSNPCPLHWQADSQPLRHQGSPIYFLISIFGLFFLFFWGGGRDLSSSTTDRTWAPAVKAWSPNHWTSREFPWPFLFHLKKIL